MRAGLATRAAYPQTSPADVIARTRDDGAAVWPDAIAIAANAPIERLNRRLASLLGRG